MFFYEKKLQFPVKIATPNPKLAAFIISQYGGPDGELGASMRYLSQRYTMPYAEAKGVLTDIGVEEFAPLRYPHPTTPPTPAKNASPVAQFRLRRRRFRVSFSLLFPAATISATSSRVANPRGLVPSVIPAALAFSRPSFAQSLAGSLSRAVTAAASSSRTMARTSCSVKSRSPPFSAAATAARKSSRLTPYRPRQCITAAWLDAIPLL